MRNTTIDAISTNPTLQGITPMTPTVHALAKTPNQATSLGGGQSKGGQGHEIMDLKGENALDFSA